MKPGLRINRDLRTGSPSTHFPFCMTGRRVKGISLGKNEMIAEGKVISEPQKTDRRRTLTNETMQTQK